MYFITNKSLKGKLIDFGSLNDMDSFPMSSKNKVFKINKCDIKNINICSKDFAYSLAREKVIKQYEKILKTVTNLLINDDDESGECYREALNQIERFKIILINKYKKFLKRKEFEELSKNLLILQKESKRRLYEIQEEFMDTLENSRSR